MKKITAALLPLYLALYDETCPSMRPTIERFYREIAEMLEDEGLHIITCPICRIEDEFDSAISEFEDAGAQAIITLHLAYSPSLESENALKNTRLPIIVLDTTPDYLFDYTIDSSAIDFNHGIHGVQDMCSLLRRNKKSFEIFAGHYKNSNVIAQVAAAVKVVGIADRFCGARIGIIGEPFKGMGDFNVPAERLAEDFGITVIGYDVNVGNDRFGAVCEARLDEEYARDTKFVEMSGISREEYNATERVALAVRDWIEAEELSGFTMNFLEAGSSPGFNTMPFSEASKAMARGLGYAGEGDVLTAALTGALLTGYQETTFAEMFCPDWANDTIYFSHMGEFNLRIADGKPHMIIKPFPYAPGFDPTCIIGHFKAGEVCLVNLAPTKNGYTLILADGEMQKLPKTIGSFENSVSGWFKPKLSLPDFLAEYSRAGGTHHSALVYGARASTLRGLASLMGFDLVII